MIKKISSSVFAAFVCIVCAATTTAKQPDIVDTAVTAGSFNTLAAALKAGGLVDALKGDGPFTVFAPTDEAFVKLPAGTVESLLKPENKQKLVEILTYHVVQGSVPAAEAVKLTDAKTLNGQRININADDSGVKINDSKVVKTDIMCSNGVIHVIDAVLLPPEKAAAADQPHHVIEKAVAKGVELYNEGHAAACADVYISAAASLLDRDDHGMSPLAMKALQASVKRASHMHCSHSKAWTMRHALNKAYAAMTMEPLSVTSNR